MKSEFSMRRFLEMLKRIVIQAKVEKKTCYSHQEEV